LIPLQLGKLGGLDVIGHTLSRMVTHGHT
jgi:hypothetical protein